METLAERIARDGPVSELDAIGWAIRLAKRLEALHMLGVAHGAISPACVVAGGRDRNARAYLADVSHVTSSLAFSSPERVLGGPISATDDVWALAATLYALLTGQSPYAASNDGEVRQKILAASPAPLAVFDVGDDDLQHILDRAFVRELPRRTSSAATFRRELEEWHPDRGVANLAPLDDEDTNDDARTLMRESETNDDDVRTVMRAPSDDASERASTPLVPRAAPSVPRPASRPAQAPQAPQVFAPAFGGRPAPPQPPLEDDTDDDDVRTVMRTPEQMAAHRAAHPMVDDETTDASVHTVVMKDADERWARAQPAAPQPAAGGSASLPFGGTLALDDQLAWGRAERIDTSPVPAAPVAAFAVGPQATQKLPPSVGAEIAAAMSAQSTAVVAVPRPLAPAPAPLPVDLGPQSTRVSFRGLFVAALIALVMAAAATFAVLKLKLL